MKILFFGSSDFCLPIVTTLHEQKFLTAIITRPNKPVGRTRDLLPSPIKTFAIEHSIPVHTPATKNELLSLKDILENYDADLAIVADYGLIIPKEIFEIPKHQTINIHFSKLPKLRGASPVQFTILTGEKTAWITIMKLDVDLDTGDILWQKEYPLQTTMTTKKLYMYLFHKVAEDLVEVITSYTRQIVIPEKQNDSAATYTRRLSRDDGRIPLEMIQGALKGTHTVLPSDQETLFSTALKAAPNTSVAIERMLRALSPWPGVWTEVMIHGESKRLKILDVHVDNGKLTPGKVQLEGKNPVDWEQFISAYDIAT